VNAGPQTEGSFTYEALVGDGWEVGTNFGNPPSGLATWFNDEFSQPGDALEITLTGGVLFTFASVEIFKLGDPSDVVSLLGFVGATQTESLLNVNATSGTFIGNFTNLVNSGFVNPIDRLRIEVVSTDSFALTLDNFNVSAVAVPEPSTVALALMGLLMLSCHGRRRRR
jgi:hypothetical protein